MREVRLIMGMPIEIEIVPTSPRFRGASGTEVEEALEKAFAYLVAVDNRFSTYKPESEIMQINRRELTHEAASAEMKEIFDLAEKTKQETNGFFDIKQSNGSLDPSGVVKGWAIKNAAEGIRTEGFENYFVNAGGDIASRGRNEKGEEWSVGIKNPFNQTEIVKVVYPRGKGIATSGSYIRGAHIYNPHDPAQRLDNLVSLTVIGSDVLEADRFATAAFAMGEEGIAFIENLDGFEGYAITKDGIATITSGFGEYTSL